MRAPEAAPDFRTTASAHPDADRRVREDLARLAACAREDPRLVALVLTGGFSRGEGTCRGGRPVNDYDLVAVRSAPGASPAAAAARRLEDELGVHVDWMDVWRPRLRLVAPKLFWYDLREGGRAIAGDPAVLHEVRAWRADHLPVEEGLRLLANRAAGLLLARGGPPHEVDVQAAKALLAVMEARLVAEGRYAPTLARRLDGFRHLAARDPRAAEALAWVERAAAWKLDPDRAPLDPAPAWSAARALLLAALRDVALRSRHGTVERWLAASSLVEAAWYASQAARRGLPRIVRRPTARCRAATLALLAADDDVPAEARRHLAAFGERPGTWEDARAATLRVRACTLQ